MTQRFQEQVFKWRRAVDLSELIGEHRMKAHHGGMGMYFGHLPQHLAYANEHSYWENSRCRSRVWDTRTRWRRMLHETWAHSADAATYAPENKCSYSRFSDLSLNANKSQLSSYSLAIVRTLTWFTYCNYPIRFANGLQFPRYHSPFTDACRNLLRP